MCFTEIRIEAGYIEILCQIIDSEYSDVMQTACLCIIYLVARAQQSNTKSLLELIQNKLSSDHHTFFTEYYFETLNAADYNQCSDDSLELLIRFNSSVFSNNLNDFFLSSDIKV